MDRPYFPFILCQLSNLACWRVVIGPAFYELTQLWYLIICCMLCWAERKCWAYSVVCLCCNMLSGKAWCAYNCAYNYNYNYVYNCAVLFPIWKATGQWVASRWSLLAQCWFRCNAAIVFIYSIVLQLHTLVCRVELGKATDCWWAGNGKAGNGKAGNGKAGNGKAGNGKACLEWDGVATFGMT